MRNTSLKTARLTACGVLVASIGLTAGLMPAGTSAGATPAAATNALFNSVSCPSQKLCIAVGDNGSGAGLVEVSQDGGAVFKSVSIPRSHALEGVTCVGTERCFAVGGNTVLWTNDGGARWSGTSKGSALTDVSCNSATHCTAVGWSSGLNGGQAYYTTNEVTWLPAATFPTFQNDLESVACNGTVCVATGEVVMVSSDGGMVWSSIGIGGGDDGLFDVSCLPTTKSCLAVGMNPSGEFNHALKGQLVRTDNDGKTFTNVSQSLNPATATVSEISCSSATTCAVVGFPPTTGALMFSMTVNRGVSWKAQTGPFGFGYGASWSASARELDISCTSSSSCVVVGSSGSGPSAVRTSDGGRKWTSSSTQPG